MIMMVVMITMTMIMFCDGKQDGAERLQWHEEPFLCSAEMLSGETGLHVF